MNLGIFMHLPQFIINAVGAYIVAAGLILTWVYIGHHYRTLCHINWKFLVNKKPIWTYLPDIPHGSEHEEKDEFDEVWNFGGNFAGGITNPDKVAQILYWMIGKAIFFTLPFISLIFIGFTTYAIRTELYPLWINFITVFTYGCISLLVSIKIQESLDKAKAKRGKNIQLLSQIIALFNKRLIGIYQRTVKTIKGKRQNSEHDGVKVANVLYTAK